MNALTTPVNEKPRGSNHALPTMTVFKGILSSFDEEKFTR